ncbi:uncharacterized protein KY384_006213 [Bacidia gigantensis]|uniref:uncharacterized protein n=1 Tax=Bacidia gigantensis TaxID=2732470 RepID=UPI001D04A7A6|nr:uncharacterized protein KY384_006213 [Bacidia gigantensis]KAG8529576.1 hypothetical protein KY384_006213 [Bacidia gigantensis]
MDNPSTSITVLLKEERTRLREAKDREEKRANKKVWVQLPDRPVTAQRQFMLW